MSHIVIIGNGVSGVTAARHIRKHSDHQITIVSAETDHFFSRTALMYIYMGHMKYEHTKPYEDYFWKKNNIQLKRGFVEEVQHSNKLLRFKDGATLSYDKLVLAVGSKPNKFGWPGQDLEGVQGLYSFQDLERLEKNAPNNKKCKRAVIVGGGLIGIELAEMLASRAIPVTFLVREQSFWNGVLPRGESEMINRHIKNHHIDLRLGVNLKEIIDDGNGRAKAAVIAETGEEIPCDLVGLTAGVSPNISFLKDSGIGSFVVITLLFFVLVGVSLSVSISEGDHFAAERGEGGKVAENRKISIGLHTRRVLIPPLIATHRHSVPKIINSL